ncbi:response regulator transcription factor [Aquibacillus salsiterrae]|uniref:Response regulator transcription factor n=1 Tax=Aquibacillus salsiterrae TaxID=2950439 RepID=A0A9X4AHU1_9BACI|nr:response regulator transcription factor [Aquibacillus salsiterrae]MDC3418690.1 response regulator transcription factor [Aquibacillus salsiterrae]
MKKTVMIVDDQEELRNSISTFLQNEGYQTVKARNGNEALRLLEESQYIDIILLDVMMPEKDGYETLRELRMAKNKTPIIMLTAKTDEVDKLLGLEMGADDYITKPFSLREVVARMKAVLRRTMDAQTDDEWIQQADIKINLSTYEVYVHDKKASLTPTEFKILTTLAEKPGRVYSRIQLLNIAMGEAFINYERSIDTHVSNLRRKLSELGSTALIQTVYGIGYRFEVET